jgi:hypothetical protein
MEELNVYVITKDYGENTLISWNVQATESEIERLVLYLKSKTELVEKVTYVKDNSKEITHQFDSDRRLWCATPIFI